MILGSIARLHTQKLSGMRLRSRRTDAVATLIAFGVLGGFSILPEPKDSLYTYLLGVPLISVSSVALILRFSNWSKLNESYLRPLLGLGTISYGAYLWNFPIIAWLGGQPFTHTEAISSIVFTVVAAQGNRILLNTEDMQEVGVIPARFEAACFDADLAGGIAAEQVEDEFADEGKIGR